MLKSAMIFATTLALTLPLAAQTKTHDHSHAEGQKHRHEHGHEHGQKSAAPAGAAAARIQAGYFDDAAVADRQLSDWAGAWQSVYPLLQSGQLDAVMAAKAVKGAKSQSDYRAYYEAGYRTDLSRIEISADRVSFERDGASLSASYAPDGHEILTYAKGNRGVRFSFRKVAGDAEAPAHIQFSDHLIAPQKSDHFHIYFGEDRAELLAEVTHWPTFYPADLSAEQIVEEMLGH